MNKYELTVVVNAKIEDDERAAVVNKAKGYIERKRCEADERSLNVTLTDEGEKLKDSAAEIPPKMGSCVNLSPEEAGELYRLLYKILSNVNQ